MVKYGDWPAEALATALYCRLFGRWYQIMGATKPEHGFDKYRTDDRRDKVEFLKMFMDFFATLKFGENQKKLWQIQKGVLCATSTIIWLQDFMLSIPEVFFYMPGRAMGNSVENLHQDIRRANPNPTPRCYKRNIKGICMTQLMQENVRGASYERDDAKEWLTSFDAYKKLQEEDDKEDIANSNFFTQAEFTPQDFTEEIATSYLAGFCLKRFSESCQNCSTFWTETSDTSDHILNALINVKEFVKDALVHPSDIGHEIFHYGEFLFKTNRDKQGTKKGLRKVFTTFLVEKINLNYENIPQCHFKQIIDKFIKTRLNFYAEYMNSVALDFNKEDIESEANASFTTKCHSLFKSGTNLKF